MLKKCLILLLIPTLLFSLEATKTYNFKQPRIIGDAIIMEGCKSSYVPFAPRLPLKNVTLLLPRGEEAVSFEVEYSEPISLGGSKYIAPFQPGGIITNPPPRDYYTRASSVYSVDAFYPSEVKSPRFFTHYRYGHPIFIASIRPVQYNPVSGDVQYFQNITVKVKTEKKRGPFPTYKFTPFIKSQLQLEVDNPEALEGLPYIKKGADDYEYALITTEALKDSWDAFVEFNTERCLRTEIKTIEDINANYPGSHQADKLKNYLIEQYNDNNILFVMLGGDDKINTSNQIQSDAITHKSSYSEFKDYGTDYIRDQDVAADMFYETLEGQELEDLEWELYAARFPADNSSELQRMIDKTIKYSTEPVTTALKKHIIAGEELWSNINGGTCWGIDLMNYLIGEHDEYYTTSGFDNSWTCTVLQEKSGNWSKNDLINHINNGLNIINHIGHSNNSMIMKLWLSENDVAKLTNNAYWIGFTDGCYCGSWDNRRSASNADFYTGHNSSDCIAEEFTCGSQNAAVAFISNTRYGLGDDGHASQDGGDGSSIRIQRFFWDGMFGQKMHHIAMMLAYSKWENKQQILNTDINAQPYYGQLTYCAYQVNCLGDPALSIWTNTPQQWTNTNYSLNGNVFTWDTENPYSWVALCQENGDIITTQLTGEDGKCQIDDSAISDYLNNNPGAKIKVRIKAHNYLPFESDMTNISNTITENFSSSFISSGKTITIKYTLPVQGMVNISLFNSKGALVKTFVNNNLTAGKYSLNLNTSDLSNGVYYCRLKFNKTQNVNKFFVAK